MSEESFKNAIMIYEKELGGRDPHLPSAYSGLGHLYYVTGRLGESESAYVRALALAEAQFGKNDAYRIISRNLDTVRKAG